VHARDVSVSFEGLAAAVACCRPFAHGFVVAGRENVARGGPRDARDELAVLRCGGGGDAEAHGGRGRVRGVGEARVRGCFCGGGRQEKGIADGVPQMQKQQQQRQGLGSNCSSSSGRGLAATAAAAAAIALGCFPPPPLGQNLFQIEFVA